MTKASAPTGTCVTVGDIASYLGVTRERVRKVAKAMGVEVSGFRGQQLVAIRDVGRIVFFARMGQGEKLLRE